MYYPQTAAEALQGRTIKHLDWDRLGKVCRLSVQPFVYDPRSSYRGLQVEAVHGQQVA